MIGAVVQACCTDCMIFFYFTPKPQANRAHVLLGGKLPMPSCVQCLDIQYSGLVSWISLWYARL